MLSLMIASSAEDCQLLLIDWCCCEEVKLKSDVLLDNVRTVVKQMAKDRVCCFSPWNPSCIHVIKFFSSYFKPSWRGIKQK